MVDINLPNIFTIGIISVVAVAAFTVLSKSMGWNLPGY